MRTSIATVSIGGTLEAKLAAAAAAGFDGIEIFENDLIASPLSPAEVRARATDLGLTIDLYQPFRDLEGVPEPAFARSLRRAEAKLDLAAELGAPAMLLCSNVGTASIDDDDLVASQLRRVGDRAAERGIRIAYEALAWGTYVNSYEHSWRLVEKADHPAVGLCLDSFHIFSRGSDLTMLPSIPGDKIVFCQLADAPALKLDPLSWSRHYRVFPGQGSFPLVDFTRALLSTGYDGPLSIEVFNDVFRQTDPERTAVDALRSLRYLEDSAATDAEKRGQVSPSILARLADAPPAEDIDFVEIRTVAHGELSAALRALGFSRRGRHRNKAVELWSQAAVRLVINETVPVPHEPSIAAVGFEFENTDAAARRAAELLAPRLERASSPGEAVLHGIAAPNSTEIYIGEESREGEPPWVGEFAGEPATASAAVGITGIDHVSLAQPWQYFDEAVLFYRSVLGLRPEQSVDVADVNGLVRSQVMRNESGSVCLVLNVLPMGAVIEPHRDGHGGADHIALRTDDLIATASELARRGLPMLQIPANYYADLKARFDLTDEYIQQLSALNVLYDRDASGVFLQAYTRTIGNVFFELVERSGDYRAFGASNSPVRRAAQNRGAVPAASAPLLR